LPLATLKPHRASFWLLIALVLIGFLMIQRHQWSADVRSSDDDVTYLSYAMSLGIDGDLDFSNELKCCANMARNGRVPGGFYGSGLMAAPFVALFSLADRLAGNLVIDDRSQYLHSWSYFGFSFAVHAYFLAAVLLLWDVARRIDPCAGMHTVLLMAFASGVYYFVAGRPRMAHGFEFFCLALCLQASVRAAQALLSRQSVRPFHLFAAALAAGLTLTVRFSDLNVVALPVLALLLLAAARQEELPRPALWLRFIATYAALLLAVLLGVGGMNRHVYGDAFLTSAVVYGTPTQLSALEQGAALQDGAASFLAEAILNLFSLFFGSEFGLLYTHPVSCLGIAAALFVLAILPKKGKSALRWLTLFLLLAYAGFSIAIVLIWRSPGMSFGYRSLFPLFPVGFLGWWVAAGLFAPLPLRKTFWAVLLCLCGFSLLGQALFTKTPDLGYRQGYAALGLEGQSAQGFEFALLRDAASAPAWSTFFKDGPIGYLNKMYFSSAYREWLMSGRTGQLPERQHPPIDGAYLAILAALWAAWGVAALRLERQGACPS
jgi:hypothetical protein